LQHGLLVHPGNVRPAGERSRLAHGHDRDEPRHGDVGHHLRSACRIDRPLHLQVQRIMSVPQEVTLARHAGDLNDDGHEFIESSVTTETDTSLRLAPDGGGGVEFVADTPSSITVQDEGTPLATAATT